MPCDDEEDVEDDELQLEENIEDDELCLEDNVAEDEPQLEENIEDDGLQLEENIEPQPEEAQEKQLKPSTLVLVHGLVMRPALNGQTGRVIAYRSERGRYAVQLATDSVMLKPGNLIAPVDPSTAGACDTAGPPIEECIVTADDERHRQLQAVLGEALSEAKFAEIAPCLAALCAKSEALLEHADSQKAVHGILQAAGVTRLGHRHQLAQLVRKVVDSNAAAASVGEAVASSNVTDVGARDLTEGADAAFRAGRYEEARRAYATALTVADVHANEERARLLCEMAAASLRLGHWPAAINDCTAALSVGAASEETRRRALAQRAQAFVETGDVAGARRDLSQLQPNDPIVSKLHLRIKRDEAGGRVAASGQGEAGERGSRDTTRSGGGVGGAGGRSSGVSRYTRWKVSCISPTTPERHMFHERGLHRCFAAQTHPNVELVVVDTGACPSPFFTSPHFTDPRVRYIYQPQHLTIGEKRNLAIQHATGDIICHFDDDDLYAPSYIATMVATMEAEAADFIKLSAWYVHDLQTGSTGHFDGEGDWPHPQLIQLREQFIYTYGFSFLYRRDLFPTFSFADTSWGEDQDILKRVRQAGRKLVLFRDTEGICVHNQHGENCSRSFAQVSVPHATLALSPLGHLLDALPIIGSALAKRIIIDDDGAYDGVVVTSEVRGHLLAVCGCSLNPTRPPVLSTGPVHRSRTLYPIPRTPYPVPRTLTLI